MIVLQWCDCQDLKKSIQSSYPCRPTRAVMTDLMHACNSGHPCSRPVFTSADCRAGRAPVSTYRVGKKHCTTAYCAAGRILCGRRQKRSSVRPFVCLSRRLAVAAVPAGLLLGSEVWRGQQISIDSCCYHTTGCVNFGPTAITSVNCCNLNWYKSKCCVVDVDWAY